MTSIERYHRQFDNLFPKPYTRPSKPMTGIEKEANEKNDAQAMWKELEDRR